MLIRCLLVLFLVAHSIVLVAQGQEIERLEVQLMNETNDTLKLRLYIELAELYDEQAPSEKSVQVILDGIELAEKNRDDFSRSKLLRLRGQIHNELHQSEYAKVLAFLNEALGIQKRIVGTYSNAFALQVEMSRTLNSIAYFYWKWGKLGESLEYYDSTIQLASMVWQVDSTNVRTGRLLSMALNSKGAVLWGLGNYEKAMLYYVRASDLFDRLGMVKFSSLVSSNIGLIYDSWGQKDEALFYFRRSVKQGLESGDHSAIGYSLSNMGKFMEAAGLYDSALYYYQKSTDKYMEEANMGGLGLNLNRLGKIYNKMGEHEKALNAFNSALTLAEQNDEYYWVAYAKQNISLALASKGDYVAALRYASESNEMATFQDYKEIMKDNYLNISKMHEQLKDYRQAHINYQLFSELKDSLFSQEKFRQITLMKEQFEAEKREKENELLRRDRLIQEQQLEQAQMEKYSLYALLLALIVFAVFFIVSRSNFKKINTELIQKNEEINRQKEVLTKQTEELKKSNQIKDLMFSIVSHDLRGPFNNLEQMVNLLNNNLLSIEEFRKNLPVVAANISQINDLTDNLLYWARSQMQGVSVSPMVLDLYELVTDKFLLFEKSAASKDISLNNEIEPGTKVFADAYMVELIMRNLITNAIKFCSAGDSINLRTKSVGGFTVVTVQDTGIGIPPEYIHRIFNDLQFSTLGTRNEKGAGIGLMICQHFVQLNGGKIWVESVYRKGSSFHFKLPMKQIVAD